MKSHATTALTLAGVRLPQQVTARPIHYRLQRVRWANRFVPEGTGLCYLGRSDVPRPTWDTDFRGFGDVSPNAAGDFFRGVCDVAVEPERFTLRANRVIAEPIRSRRGCGGARVKLVPMLGNARIPLHYI